MRIEATTAPTVSATSANPLVLLQQFWPPTALAVGFGLTLAWVTLLGYELVELVGRAF